MVATVIVKVAALAPMAKVIEPVIIHITVQVGRGEYHLAACFGVWLAIFRAAARVAWTALAAVARAAADQPHDQRPFRVVIVIVNGHYQWFL